MNDIPHSKDMSVSKATNDSHPKCFFEFCNHWWVEWQESHAENDLASDIGIDGIQSEISYRFSFAVLPMLVAPDPGKTWQNHDVMQWKQAWISQTGMLKHIVRIL